MGFLFAAAGGFVLTALRGLNYSLDESFGVGLRRLELYTRPSDTRSQLKKCVFLEKIVLIQSDLDHLECSCSGNELDNFVVEHLAIHNALISEDKLAQFQRALVIDLNTMTLTLLSGSSSRKGIYQTWYLSTPINNQEGSWLAISDESIGGRLHSEEIAQPATTGAAILLDLHLFLPTWVYSNYYQEVMSSVGHLINPLSGNGFGRYFCSSLAISLYGGDFDEVISPMAHEDDKSSAPRVFTLVSGHTLSSNMLLYWLNFCSIDAPVVVHLWPQRNATGRDTFHFVRGHGTNDSDGIQTSSRDKENESSLLRPSPCNVRKVTGSARLEQQQQHRQNVMSPFAVTTVDISCLEDVIDLLYPHGRRLTFASSLGLGSIYYANSSSWHSEYFDLVHVLRAFFNHNALSSKFGLGSTSGLIVVSIFNGLWLRKYQSDSCVHLSQATIDNFGVSLNIQLLDLMHHRVFSPELQRSSCKVWSAKIEKLKGCLNSIFQGTLKECVDRIGTSQLLRLLLSSLQEIALKTHQSCSSVSSLSSGYFCTNFAARIDVSSVVRILAAKIELWWDNQGGRSSRSSSVETKVLAALRQISIRIESDPFSRTTKSLNCYDKNPHVGFVRPTLNVGFSFTYVLVFVLPMQVLLAQEIIDVLKKKCNTRVCHLYASYYVFPVMSEHEIHGGDASSKTVDHPSQRLAFLRAHEFIIDFLRSTDLVSILVGLDSLLSFPAINANTGFIPPTEYNSNAYYRLPASIVIASSSSAQEFSDTGTNSSTSCIPSTCTSPKVDSVWETRALSGVVQFVDQLLDFVKNNDPSVIQGGDRSVHCAILRFASQHPRDTFLDIDGEFFDMILGRRVYDAILRVSSGGVMVDGIFSLLSHYPVFFSGLGDSNLKNELANGISDLHSRDPSKCILQESSISSLLHAISTLRMANSIEAIATVSMTLINNSFSCCIFSQDQFLLALQPTRFLLDLSKYSRHIMEDVSFREILATRQVLLQHLGYQHQFGDQMHLGEQCKVRNGCVVNIESRFDNDPFDNDHLGNIFHNSIYSALSGVAEAIGDFDSMITAFSNSLAVAEFNKVVQVRDRERWRHWGQQTAPPLLRNNTNSITLQVPKTHFITMASNATEALNRLQMTAKLSGVDLVTLGVGLPWRGNRDKVRCYLEYLQQPESKVGDDDLVVLIDAYDVLLFPAATRLGITFAAEATTPIVFCSESGIYPEFASAYFYRRGIYPDAQWRSDKYYQRFYNTGCIVGRAAQVREMLYYAQSVGISFEDDQHLLIRYALGHPELVSMDHRRQYFLTTHKLSSELGVDLDFTLLENEKTELALGVVHCNNIASNFHMHYGRLSWQYYKIVESFFMGIDGPDLMLAVSSLAMRNYSRAYKILLKSPQVISNMTSNGGTNCVGEFFLVKYSQQFNLSDDLPFRRGAGICSTRARSLRLSYTPPHSYTPPQTKII